MPSLETTINDEDLGHEFKINVEYICVKASPSRYSQYGWSEPEAAHIEIDSIVVKGGSVCIGKRYYPLGPLVEHGRELASYVGEQHEAEIIERCERDAAALFEETQ